MPANSLRMVHQPMARCRRSGGARKKTTSYLRRQRNGLGTSKQKVFEKLAARIGRVVACLGYFVRLLMVCALPSGGWPNCSRVRMLAENAHTESDSK